ncbi:hypothetical protein GQ472_04430 [archaeon]|nr:hypothetical protein [archaeon]
MIDIIAYALVTFFLFLTSLAVLEIKARTEHRPDTRMSELEQMIIKAFNIEQDKDDGNNKIDIDSIRNKIAPETEHVMALEKAEDLPAKDEFKAEIDEIQESAPEHTEKEPEDELEMLINRFEEEVNKAKESRSSEIIKNE